MENKGNKKQSLGRQKIEIKKIADKSKRLVSFSKRRVGLFSKAGELSVLTGAEVAVIVESPSGKIHSFGNPSSETVIRRYAGGESYVQDNVQSSNDKARVEESRKKYMEVLEGMRAKQAFEEAKGGGKGEGFWWEESFENLGLHEVEGCMAAIEALKRNLSARADELDMAAKKEYAKDISTLLNPNMAVKRRDYLVSLSPQAKEWDMAAMEEVNDESSSLIPKMAVERKDNLVNLTAGADELDMPTMEDPTDGLIPNIAVERFGGLPVAYKELGNIL